MKSYSTLVRHPGNEGLFRACEISAVSQLAGWPLHVHAEGLRGTGKTSVLRAMRQALPAIERLRGCPYNCHPQRPHCPLHAGLSGAALEQLGSELVPMPFLEISHSAKLGTVVGTIDLDRLTSSTGPEAALLPGTLARAHRGIVLVDEINRLADTAPELTDVMLDVMGTRPGRLQIEESGLPKVEMDISVAVWAASNPDEEPGPLEHVRKQLSEVDRPEDPSHVVAVLAGSWTAQAGGRKEGVRGLGPDQGLAMWEAAARLRLGERVPQLEQLLADLYVRFNLESLRAVESALWAARTVAALSGDGQSRP